MADFRQLALEFVLADDEGKQNSLAKQAASGARPFSSRLRDSFTYCVQRFKVGMLAAILWQDGLSRFSHGCRETTRMRLWKAKILQTGLQEQRVSVGLRYVYLDGTDCGKALEFLSRTLQYLDPTVLKPSQGMSSYSALADAKILTLLQSSYLSAFSAPCLT